MEGEWGLWGIVGVSYGELRCTVGVRMEQLRQIFNLRTALISETHAPVQWSCGCNNVHKRTRAEIRERL